MISNTHDALRMANNTNLGAAKAAKNDEFYTQYADIQKEVNAYCERVLQGSSMAFARGGYYEYNTKTFIKQIIRKIIGKREQPNPNYIINLMQCETHRWAILRALRQQAAFKG